MKPPQNRWLLLIHNLPPKPDYFRVKIWRRLQRVGAVAVKNSVYVLPKTDATLEDFQWVAREIAQGGGDASLCEAGFVEGLTDAQIESMFRAARDADYAAIADEARQLARTTRARRFNSARGELDADVSRLRRRLTEVAALDFFDSLGRQTAEGLVANLEKSLRPDSRNTAREAAKAVADYQARVWVTRKGIHVDRMASAWLIKRFIDQHAKFKFVPARGYRVKKGEVCFDMFEAEFTHEGDRCTFEVLLAAFAPNVAPLSAIAEIVHSIDLKDGKFERSETPGIEALITGLCIGSKDDLGRLRRSHAIFDDLFDFFSSRRE